MDIYCYTHGGEVHTRDGYCPVDGTLLDSHLALDAALDRRSDGED